MRKVLLSKALERYRKEVSSLKKGRSQESYRIDQLIRSPLGTKMVHEITSVDIASYRDVRLLALNPKTKESLSPATVRLELALLSSFFDIALKEWGYCKENPVLKVRKPKVSPGRERRVSRREERLILRFAHSYSNRELFSIVVLAIESAMRQGEILKLRWEDVNLRSRTARLHDTKNGSQRDIPLSIRAREAIMRLGVKSEGLVFSYKSAGLKSVWRAMNITLGITDLHFHDLRHEATSRLFELGTLDMMEVASITGHKSLAMLKRYTHLKAQRLVRKLDGSRNRLQQVFTDAMQPYPAQVLIEDDKYKVRVLDFEDIEGYATSEEEASRIASARLLERISILAISGKKIPQPDQYLDLITEGELTMVYPVRSSTSITEDQLFDTVLS